MSVFQRVFLDSPCLLYDVDRSLAVSPEYRLEQERGCGFQVEDSETDIMITLNLGALYAKIKRVVDQTRIKKLIVADFYK